MQQINIIVSHRHTIFRRGIKALLLEEKTINVIAEASNRKQLFSLAAKRRPDVVISGTGTDLNDIKHFHKSFKKQFPGIKIIYVINDDSLSLTKTIVKLGASGHLSIADSRRQLIKALKNVIAGKAFVSKKIQSELLDSMMMPSYSSMIGISVLTKREKEILQLIAKEYITNEIADKLFISRHTVESHRKNLLQKVNVRNTAGLVRFAVEHDMVN